VARACSLCRNPDRPLVDSLILAGAPGTAIIKAMAEKGHRVNHGNLNTHRNHAVPADRADEMDRLVRALEAEANAAPPTVEALYRMLIRGVRATATGRPPTATELVRLATAIKEITGMSYKQEMLAAYMRSRFSPEQIAEDQERAAQQRGEAGYPAPLLDDELEL
jgi:hypothetical protein